MADPDNALARAAMLEGAALAGRCLLNAGMGVHHGLAQLVGGRTGIPHGLANAILLTHSIAFNAEAVPDEVGRLSAALGAEAAGAVDALRAGIGLPGRLSEVGVDEADLEAVRPPVAVERQRRPQPAARCPRTTPGPSSKPPTDLPTVAGMRRCPRPDVALVAAGGCSDDDPDAADHHRVDDHRRLRRTTTTTEATTTTPSRRRRRSRCGATASAWSTSAPRPTPRSRP